MNNQARFNINAMYLHHDESTNRYSLYRFDRPDEPITYHTPEQFADFILTTLNTTWHIGERKNPQQPNKKLLVLTRELWFPEDLFPTLPEYIKTMNNHVQRIIDYNIDQLQKAHGAISADDDTFDDFERANIAHILYLGFNTVLKIATQNPNYATISTPNTPMPHYILGPLVNLLTY